MRTSVYHSLLAWNKPQLENIDPSGKLRALTGLLAQRPDAFADCRKVVQWKDSLAAPCELLPGCLQVKMPIVTLNEGWVAVLNCHYEDNFNGPIGLRLHLASTHRVSANRSSRTFHVAGRYEDRTVVVPCENETRLPEPEDACIKSPNTYYTPLFLIAEHTKLWLRCDALIQAGWAIAEMLPRNWWNMSTHVMIPRPAANDTESISSVQFKKGDSSFEIAFHHDFSGTRHLPRPTYNVMPQGMAVHIRVEGALRSIMGEYVYEVKIFPHRGSTP